jgi:uncharacterized protein (DUF1684 family)
MHSYLELLDYRRRVFALYAEVRALAGADGPRAHARWRAVRDELFGRHPQSALDAAQRTTFSGLRYYPYDPSLVFTVEVEADEEAPREAVGTSGPDPLAFHRFGWVELPFGRLAVYWLDAYGGGLFLPFRDATAGDTTYGGGRYLLDTVKGADLGATPDGALILDFNFAYHPSCHYNPIWVCPLAPPANRLPVPIAAGEQVYSNPVESAQPYHP